MVATQRSLSTTLPGVRRSYLVSSDQMAGGSHRGFRVAPVWAAMPALVIDVSAVVGLLDVGTDV
jgi:hypothetical protein